MCKTCRRHATHFWLNPRETRPRRCRIRPGFSFHHDVAVLCPARQSRHRAESAGAGSAGLGHGRQATRRCGCGSPPTMDRRSACMRDTASSAQARASRSRPGTRYVGRWPWSAPSTPPAPDTRCKRVPIAPEPRPTMPAPSAQAVPIAGRSKAFSRSPR